MKTQHNKSEQQKLSQAIGGLFSIPLRAGWAFSSLWDVGRRGLPDLPEEKSTRCHKQQILLITSISSFLPASYSYSLLVVLLTLHTVLGWGSFCLHYWVLFSLNLLWKDICPKRCEWASVFQRRNWEAWEESVTYLLQVLAVCFRLLLFVPALLLCL